ncbi:MAG: hypothetical protein Q4D98_00095 [Planctomycetia bacterium]|nr:hypothetical protein [Planctomycetia bacterium]
MKRILAVLPLFFCLLLSADEVPVLRFPLSGGPSEKSLNEKERETILSQTEPVGLDFSGRVLTDDDLRLLEKVPHLRFLRLGNRNLELLAQLPEIRELQIEEQPFSPEKPPLSDAALAGLKNLKRLEKLQCNVNDAWLKALEGLPELREIESGNSRNLTLEGWKSLAKIPNLKRLCLRNVTLDAEEIKVLAQIPLEELLLSHGSLSGEKMAPFSQMRTLRKIHLSENDLKDADVARFAELPELREFSVVASPLTDACLESLAKMPRLENLHLIGTQITGEGLKKWEGKKPLQILNVTHCPNVSAAQVAELMKMGLAKQVLWRQHTSPPPVPHAPPPVPPREVLTKRFTFQEPLTDADIQTIRAATGGISLQLTFDAFRSGKVGTLKDLPQLREMTVMNRMDDHELPDNLLSQIAELTSLERLQISGLQKPDANFRLLASLTQMKQLALTYTSIQDADLEALLSMKSLETLNLSGSRQLTAACVPYLQQFPALRSLSIAYTSVPPHALAGLASMKTLESIPSVLTLSTSDDLEALASLPFVRSLILQLPTYSPRDCECLRNMPRLRSLHLTGRVTDEAMERLKGMPELDFLTLSDPSELTKNGLAMLKTMPKLRELKLSYMNDRKLRGLAGLPLEALHIDHSNVFTDEGLEPIFTLKNLQTLSLHSPLMEGSTLSRLAELPRLSQLSLSGRMLRKDCLKPLESLSQIQFLTIRNAWITDSEVKQFTPPKTLVRIQFVSCPVTQETVAELKKKSPRLSHALVSQRSAEYSVVLNLPRLSAPQPFSLGELPFLTTSEPNDATWTEINGGDTALGVDLSYSDVTDADLEKITAGGRIVALSLNRCEKITDRSLEFLARHCPELRQLQLGGCPGITDDGLRQLATLENLESLALWKNRQITSEGWNALLLHSQLLELYAGNTNLSDADLSRLCVLQKLQLLSLHGCSNVTDAGLEFLDAMKALRILYLGRCEQLTPTSLITLAQAPFLEFIELPIALRNDTAISLLRQSARLKSLVMENGTVTDAGLREFLDSRSIQDSLVRLNLNGCQSITDHGVAAVVSCKRLLEIRLRGCVLLTDETFNLLEGKRVPQIDLNDCPRISPLRWKQYLETHANF